MTDKVTNAYALHGEISEHQRKLDDERKSLQANQYSQHFFSVGTWIIYLLFAAAMYAAPLWVLQSFFGANAGNYLAIAVIGLFLVVFPTALSWGKYASYKALSKRGVDPRWMGLIIAFFISSGIYFEMTSASSQQQEKAHQAVENSNAGKSIMGTTISTGTSDYAALLADAEYKLVACQRKLDEGKTKDCKNSQARVDSLKSQAQADREAAVTATAQAIPLKQAALEKERESHALPIAKSFAELFSSTIATGAVIAALIAALIFEISHAMTIYNEWQLKADIAALEANLKQMKVDYFHQTGKQFDVTDFMDGEIINLVEMRENGTLKHFNDQLRDESYPPAPAKTQSFGFIPDAPSMRASTGFKQTPEQQKTVEALYEKQLADYQRGKTYREALRDGSRAYRDVPLDKKHPPTGDKNPVLGTAEHQNALPLPEPQKPRSDAGSDAIDISQNGGSAADEMANPNNFALLQKHVQHPQFGHAFIAVATGKIPCSQKQMMKHFRIGGEMTYWMMIIMEAFEIVTEPNTNNHGKRELTNTLTEQQANNELNAIKLAILGEKYAE